MKGSVEVGCSSRKDGRRRANVARQKELIELQVRCSTLEQDGWKRDQLLTRLEFILEAKEDEVETLRAELTALRNSTDLSHLGILK